MLAARLVVCQVTRPTTNILRVKPVAWSEVRVQKFASQSSRGAFRRRTTLKQEFEAPKRSWKEILLAPASDSAFTIGKGALAGASAFGLGALCYYGLGLSNDLGAIDRSVAWPEYVRKRIQTTYAYFGGSLIFTAASAYAAFQSKSLMRFYISSPYLSFFVSLGALIASSAVLHSLPYTNGIGAKEAFWVLHSGLVGAVLAPMCVMGGPLLLRAAYYTAGVVGGLSLLAGCAPSERFLQMGGPLAMGLGVVFVSSLGTLFLPATTALGAGLYSISLYGGLIVFGGFLLYDTQRIIKMAEVWPEDMVFNTGKRFDPINASTSIYMDTINIFVRIAMILAGGGNKRR